ncbi:hypothetical protein CGCS363_v013517 [Colletotrichum siamense]|uniref:uncharacterized protein n=1 Tax=Colletotrichum siamense TaxID=690259 RepID=UPI001872E7E8|nr:uncharacterized protein CGCS363_v013517 [Colletotrichum siamense]KAF5486804.1 hypothetical protein CGCS363_v013517 [Colletotrichum siamense]
MASRCLKSCFDDPGELEPNPDISGIGVSEVNQRTAVANNLFSNKVLVAFLGTAWLVVILVAFRYFLAFNPRVDSLYNPRRDEGRDRAYRWKPNAVDVKVIHMFSRLRRRLGYHIGWDLAMNKILLNLTDIQLLTGLGILFSSFLSLRCYMSSYHWQINTYLAWFSSLTHTACLSALRGYFYRNQIERNFRMLFMSILFVGLITALVPTGYFNWDNSQSLPTAGVPASNVRCFFSQRVAQDVWNHRTCANATILRATDGNYCNPSGISMTSTKAFESSVISILLLSFSFIGRFIKMFRTVSEIAKDNVRETTARLAVSGILATIRAYHRYGATRIRKKILAVVRPLDLMIAAYLAVKLYLEVVFSELADAS